MTQRDHARRIRLHRIKRIAHLRKMRDEAKQGGDGEMGEADRIAAEVLP